MEECFRCGERKHLHTHHIFPQKNFQDGKQEKNGYRKNALYNLIVLCEHCHHSVHHEDVVEMKTK
jgi:5-methylcytosine-specific restriction endonuclease McrA